MDQASGLHLKQGSLESTDRERRPEKVSGEREEGSSAGKVLQKQNPFVAAPCLPSGVGACAPGSRML